LLYLYIYIYISCVAVRILYVYIMWSNKNKKKNFLPPISRLQTCWEVVEKNVLCCSTHNIYIGTTCRICRRQSLYSLICLTRRKIELTQTIREVDMRFSQYYARGSHHMFILRVPMKHFFEKLLSAFVYFFLYTHSVHICALILGTCSSAHAHERRTLYYTKYTVFYFSFFLLFSRSTFLGNMCRKLLTFM